MDLIDRSEVLKYKCDCYDINDHLLYAVPTGNIIRLPSIEVPSYVAEIEAEYKKAVSQPWIHKPLAKALYEVWKKHDREDVSRHETD